jgi:hypothetical protein
MLKGKPRLAEQEANLSDKSLLSGDAKIADLRRAKGGNVTQVDTFGLRPASVYASKFA